MKQNNFLSSLTKEELIKLIAVKGAAYRAYRYLLQKLAGYGWRVVSINRTEIWNG